MDKAFQTHKLNQRGFAAATDIAESFDRLLINLAVFGCDTGTREFAIVRSKLEEACFFAKKAMAQRSDMQAL